MKLKKSDIAVITVIILLVIIIFILMDRNYKWFGYNDNVIKVDGNCIRIECTHHGKTDAILEDEDDINACIETLSEIQLRKKDFIDVILDPDTYKTGNYLGAEKRYITMTFENGNEVSVSFYPNIEEIYYNDDTYMVKGTVPKLIYEIFD